MTGDDPALSLETHPPPNASLTRQTWRSRTTVHHTVNAQSILFVSFVHAVITTMTMEVVGNNPWWFTRVAIPLEPSSQRGIVGFPATAEPLDWAEPPPLAAVTCRNVGDPSMTMWVPLDPRSKQNSGGGCCVELIILCDVTVSFLFISCRKPPLWQRC
ncbi:hypothetical protein Sjap_011185 [Stephania japonica]|uniref:Uncharacterized protein n=1 Tax=Stephania japonica TaxID=461633 RepID=A0AAP0JD09_9MAGN